jgi:tRNA (cmo5U34)-methyltransferase
MLTRAVAHIGRHYITEGGIVYDIGAGLGNISIALADVIEARNAKMISIEASAEMIKKFRGSGEILHSDARQVHFQDVDLIVCFLVCMFFPPEDVWRFLHRAKEGLHKGGALIVLEKLENRGGYLGSVFYRMTLAEKLYSGADPKRILEKELSLAGVQRPLDEKIFRELDAVEFFRFGDFAGYVVER